MEKEIRAAAAELKWPQPELFMVIHIDVTGKTATLPLFETMIATGQEKVLGRLTFAAREGRMDDP